MNLTQIALDLISSLGYSGLFLGLFLDSFGIPIPSEVLVPLATALALQGRFALAGVFAVGVLAQVTGGLAGYYIGRYAGEPFLEKYGRWLVMVGRCIPIIRGFIAYPAGIAEMPVPTFIVYTAIGSAFWTLMLMGLGVLLQNNLELIDAGGKKFSLAIIALLFVYVVWHIWHVTRPPKARHDPKDEAK